MRCGQSNYLVESGYDLKGRRTRVNYPDGRYLYSYYDAMDRLVRVKHMAEVTDYTYDKNGNRLSCEYPNRVLNSYMLFR